MSDDESAGHSPRRWPRINLNASAKLHFDDFGPQLAGRIINASERGLFLATDHPRPIGTQIRITIEVADPPIAVTVTGVVIHVVTQDTKGATLPPGFGVFLTEAGDAWVRFCQHAAKK